MYRDYFKRFLDFIISLAILIIIWPILVLTGLGLHFANKGAGAFFLQERPGRHAKIFKVIKFKTMTDERDSFGNLLSDEQRLTKIGRFIRSTSIDELPQFFNVLIGDMSFIGPRPVTTDRPLEEYDEKRKIRLEVRPGITGYSQAYFRNSISNEEKLEKDAFYARNVTFGGDLKIIFATVNTVVFRKNIYNKKNR